MAEVNLEMLQAMVQRVLDGQAELKADMIEVKERLGLIEGQYSSISRRADRISGDVDQIRRRLDLADAP
jgi:predicted nuclease with TOPRIM domain